MSMPSKYQITRKKLVSRALEECTRGNDLVAFDTCVLLEQKFPVQRVKGCFLTPAEENCPCHVIDAGALFDIRDYTI